MTVTVAGKRRMVDRNASLMGAGAGAMPRAAVADMISSRVSLASRLLHLQLLSMQVYKLGRKMLALLSLSRRLKANRVVIPVI
ncbi:hypothetical protein AB9F35_01880 [Rhizobium leguminosarum]|uniref:hypothetical protein n=1 Tax=Rhizobium TaxID=379 RepID=UPI0013D5F9D5|nr:MULTISPECIES: hypothetical protein [Rhizobium]MBY5313024.1 hypothetical protein [Rhizobium leguminosarum]